MKRFTVLASLIAMFAASACSDQSAVLAPDGPAASIVAGPGIKVMSQNMYLGANIDLLLTATTPAEIAQVFQQLGISTLSGTVVAGVGFVPFKRAQQMAVQIATQAPDLVGLQEVTRYVIAGVGTVDFLTILQGYLTQLHNTAGTPLYTAIPHANTTVQFTASGFPEVTYTDGDAILVKQGVTLTGSPTLKSYDTFEQFSVAGVSFDNHRGYMAVTAEVNGQSVRFGNTHLEVQMFEPTQVAQTAELIEAFDQETIPVILVGDFNSAANHDAPDDQKTESYRMLRNAGYSDIWLRGAHSVSGYTCCQNATLTNTTTQLTQRLDLVLVRWNKAGFGGQSNMEILGQDAADRITFTDPQLGSLTLWPSDHAAVAATLWPAPGQLAKAK